MDPENETHPLLHDFENETWRSRTRKRCLRIPSEAAITGLILGVFFVVVTLLIVLENMEKTKKDDISIDKKLLASPGFNQKLADKSWKDEKLRKLDKANKDWKILSDLSDSPKYNKKQKGKSWQDEKQRKFDKVNKGWKILPNVTGNRDNRWDDDEDMKDKIDPKQISIVADEYGREEDERWSSFFSAERRDPILQKNMNKDMNEIVNVLQSPMIKREKINEEWRKLSELGWKDYEIRKALLKVLIERKNELNGTGDENVQNSPMNLDQLWDEINKSWQEKVEEGRAVKEYRRLIHSKGAKDQKSINDAWKDKMAALQSPKAAAKKEAREDDGWENLSGQGWKNKDIEEALINAWKEKDKEENLLMSPMNLQSLWEKASDFIKNVMQQKDNKNTDKIDGGSKNNMLSPSNFEALKSVMETSKKYKKDYKKSDNDEKTENESSLNLNLKDFIDFIMEKIKKQQKDKMDENTDEINNGSMVVQYSSLNLDDFIQNLITEAMKDHDKVNKDMKDNQKSINDVWKNKMNNLETTKTSDQKWKTINDHWKALIEHERNSYFGKNDGSRTSTTDGGEQKILMSSGKMKWKNVNNGYKKLSTNGWNDKDIKDAVDKASRDGEQMLEKAVGYNSMKWKKVNDGYKKTYNKS